MVRQRNEVRPFPVHNLQVAGGHLVTVGVYTARGGIIDSKNVFLRKEQHFIAAYRLYIFLVIRRCWGRRGGTRSFMLPG